MTVIGRQNGVVIIAVLWICALIMWFALQIGAQSRLTGEEEVHLVRRSQALHLAIGGAYEALARMGQMLPLDRDEPLDANWQPDGRARMVNYQTGQAMVIIEREDHKVNINVAAPVQLRAALVRAGVEDERADGLADVIADFIDADDLVRLQGAEEDAYEQMGLPYGPFNGPLLSLDQMLLIPGVDQQLFFFGHEQDTDETEATGPHPLCSTLLPRKNSLFQLLTVHGSNQTMREEDDFVENEPEIVTWEADAIYRILSCGASYSGSPSVLLWLVVRYDPDTEEGFEILHRKIL